MSDKSTPEILRELMWSNIKRGDSAVAGQYAAEAFHLERRARSNDYLNSRDFVDEVNRIAKHFWEPETEQ